MNAFRGMTHLDQQDQAAKMGDLLAFNRMTANYSDEIYTLAFALTGEEQAALEVSQDAVVSAFRGLSEMRVGNLRSWLLAKTIEAGWKYARRKPGEFSSHLPGLGETLNKKMEHVSEDGCLALLLVDLLGMSYEEASWAAGCPQAEVSRRLTLARRQIL